MHAPSRKRKIKTIQELGKISAKARKEGKVVVTTNGAFDLLHIGHIRNLAEAKSLGDILIVGINSDRSVRTHKDKFRPILPQTERAETLAELESVDYVFIFDDPTPIRWIAIIKPNIHAKGADRKLAQMPERFAVKRAGGKIVRIPYSKNYSTTRIVDRLTHKLSKVKK